MAVDSNCCWASQTFLSLYVPASCQVGKPIPVLVVRHTACCMVNEIIIPFVEFLILRMSSTSNQDKNSVMRKLHRSKVQLHSFGTILIRLHDPRSPWLLATLRCHNGDDNENIKKAIGWIGKTTTLLVIMLFCTFVCCYCTAMMGKCLISCFMEDVNKRQLNFLSFSKLEYGS